MKFSQPIPLRYKKPKPTSITAFDDTLVLARVKKKNDGDTLVTLV